MTELGCYDARGQAKIEINNNKTPRDFEVTMAHELIHKQLTESTNYGYVIFLLNQIIHSDDTPEIVKKRLLLIYKSLFENMLKLQEGVAAFMELTWIKATSPRDYLQKYSTYKRDPYYNNYIFKLLDNLKEYPIENVMDITLSLAHIAMNINLNDLNINQKHFSRAITSDEKTVLLINPNIRLKNMLKQLVKCSDNYSEKEFNAKRLAQKSGITFSEVSVKDFMSWATDNIITVFKLLPIEKYMQIQLIKDNLHWKEAVINSVSSYTSILRYTRKSVSQMNLDDKKLCFIYIAKYYNETYEIQYIDVVNGTIYTHETKQLVSCIEGCRFILCDRYYYEGIRADNPVIDNYIVFIRMNGIFDPYGLNFLNKYSEKHYHFHEINTNNLSVFIKSNQRTYLFDIFPKIQSSSMMNILKDYHYVNYPDDSMIDNIFYYTDTDWWIFEDVLSYCIQRKFLPSTDEYISLGYRMRLS